MLVSADWAHPYERAVGGYPMPGDQGTRLAARGLGLRVQLVQLAFYTVVACRQCSHRSY